MTAPQDTGTEAMDGHTEGSVCGGFGKVIAGLGHGQCRHRGTAWARAEHSGLPHSPCSSSQEKRGVATGSRSEALCACS